AQGGRDPSLLLGGTSAATLEALEVRGGLTLRERAGRLELEAGVDGVGGWELGPDDRFAGSLGLEARLGGSLSLAPELTLALQARLPATVERDVGGSSTRTALHAGPELAWTRGALAARVTWLPRLAGRGPELQ